MGPSYSLHRTENFVSIVRKKMKYGLDPGGKKKTYGHQVTWTQATTVPVVEEVAASLTNRAVLL